MSTLANIRTKIRRLTRNPSPSQLTDANIDDYVNTFIMYDFPEHLRLFALRETVTFYTRPYIDTYATNTVLNTDPLFDFKNRYISVHPPVYIAGYPSFFSQSREQFFGIYPMVNNIASTGFVGNGVTMTFFGTVANAPILRNQVLFSSVDANNNGLSIIDDGAGHLIIPNATGLFVGVLEYDTGGYIFTFPTPPAIGAAINSQTVPYVAARPIATLYYNEQFIVRPVPDQPYRVDIEAYRRPSALLAAGDQPELNQWWQYIAYGAAKKIFEDRMDPQSVEIIMPEFKQQEVLVLRRTIMQHANDRTATVYTEQTGAGTGGFGLGSGNF